MGHVSPTGSRKIWNSAFWTQRHVSSDGPVLDIKTRFINFENELLAAFVDVEREKELGNLYSTATRPSGQEH